MSSSVLWLDEVPICCLQTANVELMHRSNKTAMFMVLSDLPHWISGNGRRMSKARVTNNLTCQREKFVASCQQCWNIFANLCGCLIHTHFVQSQRFFRPSLAIKTPINRWEFPNAIHATGRIFGHIHDLLQFLGRTLFGTLSTGLFVLQLSGQPLSRRCQARYLILGQRWWQLQRCPARRWWGGRQRRTQIRWQTG